MGKASIGVHQALRVAKQMHRRLHARVGRNLETTVMALAYPLEVLEPNAL